MPLYKYIIILDVILHLNIVCLILVLKTLYKNLLCLNLNWQEKWSVFFDAKHDFMIIKKCYYNIDTNSYSHISLLCFKKFIINN